VITGETVTVYTWAVTGEDGYNMPVVTETQATVGNVLVAPGPRSDLGAERPDADRIAWTLHFPKTFTGSLAGARVSVRGGEPLEVVGDPQPYTDANTPGDWNRPVELLGVDG